MLARTAELAGIDRLQGDAAARRFRRELARGRWQEFHEFLDTSRDLDDRHFYINELSRLRGRPAWLDEWAAARPQSALPLLFRGSHGIHWAWAARGSGRGLQVRSSAWQAFYDRLVAADRDLAAASALDPADPTPHARAIWAAMGLQLGQDEVWRRYQEAERRQQWHRDANQSMIQALAGKWGGSDAQTLQFARAVSANAPEGNGIHSVLAIAHLEQWESMPYNTYSSRLARVGYFRQAAVQQEILLAARRSVFSPGHQPTRKTIGDQNIFAMCFYLMRDRAALREQLDQLGRHILPWPWEYLGQPGRAFSRARALARRGRGTTVATDGRPVRP